MNPVATSIILFRHGQTDWNINEQIQGHTDIPLNQEGERQALGLQDKLKGYNPVAVFSSDLSRASKTAGIVLGDKKVEIIHTPALRERYMANWEGRLVSELMEWLKQQEISVDSFTQEEYLSHKWNGDVESYGEVYGRLSRLIKSEAPSRLGSTLFMSAHGGVLRSVLYTLNYKPDLKWQVSNCAFIKLQVSEAGEITIEATEGITTKKEANLPF